MDALSDGGISAGNSHGSTVSQQERNIAVLKGTSEYVLETYTRLNNVRRLCCHNFITFVLEVISLLMVIYLVTKDSTLYVHERDHFIYFIYLDPLMLTKDRVLFETVLYLCWVFSAIFIAFFLYVFYSKTNNDLLLFIFYWWSRLMRTIFLIPTLHVFSASFLCQVLDGSFEFEDDGMSNVTLKCYDFTNLSRMVLSTISVTGILLIGSFDTLFILDKFGKGGMRNCWTSSPSGRANLCLYVLKVLSILTGVLVEHQNTNWFSALSQSLQLIPLCLFVLLIILFIPWYHVQYVYIISTLLLMLIVCKFCGALTKLTESYIAISSLVLFFIFCPILWIILGLRYLLAYLHFRKRVKSNFFLCNCATDIAVGLFLQERVSRWFGLKKIILSFRKIRKVRDVDSHQPVNYFDVTSSRKMVELIFNLLNDEKIKKTKALCCHIVTMIIDENPLLAKSVINHTNTMMNVSFFDVELWLEIYRQRISALQETGALSTSQSASSPKKERLKKSKMMELLNRVRRKEKKISMVILRILNELDQDDNKLSFSQLPKLLGTFQEELAYSRDLYRRLVKIHPSPITYNRYSRFLMNFCGDHGSAKIYRREAKQLEVSLGSRRNMREEEEDEVVVNDGIFGMISPNFPNKVRKRQFTTPPTPAITISKRKKVKIVEEEEEEEGEEVTDDDDDEEEEEEEEESTHAPKKKKEELSTPSSNKLSFSNSLPFKSPTPRKNKKIRFREEEEEYEKDIPTLKIDRISTTKTKPKSSSSSSLFMESTPSISKKKSDDNNNNNNTLGVSPTNTDNEEVIIIKYTPRSTVKYVDSVDMNEDEDEEEKELEEGGGGGFQISENYNELVKTPCKDRRTSVLFGSIGEMDSMGHYNSESNNNNNTSNEFSDGNSINNNTTTTTSSTYDGKLSKKVNSKLYISAVLIRWFCCIVFFAVIIVGIILFSLTIYLGSHFTTTADLIENSSRIQKGLTEVSYLVRKLQTSFYDESVTPFEFERNSTFYWEMLVEKCNDFDVDVNSLQDRLSSGQRNMLADISVELETQIEEDAILLYLRKYHTENYRLLDAITTYRDYCFKALAIPIPIWNDTNHVYHDYLKKIDMGLISIDNATVNENISVSCITTQLPIIFLLYNEHAVRDGITLFMSLLFHSEKEKATQFIIVYNIIPIISLLLMVMNCCLCLMFQYEERKSFRGLMLIPKYELKNLKKKFSGFVNTDGRGFQKTRRFSTVTNSPNFVRRDQQQQQQQQLENINLQKVDVISFTLIQKFCFSNCLILLICYVLYSVFAVIGTYTCVNYVSRNLELDTLFQFESSCIEVGLATMDYLYRNDSLFGPTDYMGRHGLEEMYLLMENYEIMKYGGETPNGNQNGNEDEGVPYGVYYEDKHDGCQDEVVNDESDLTDELLYLDEYYEFLKCKNLNYKMEVVRSASIYIFNTYEVLVPSNETYSPPEEDDHEELHDYPVIIHNLDEIKRSLYYLSIAILVSYSNSSQEEGSGKGALYEEFRVLEDFVSSKLDVWIEVLLSLSILLIIVFLPAFSSFYCWRFYSYGSKLNKHLLTVKKLLLLMDKNVIYSKNIYDYLTRNNYLTSISRIFKQERINRLNLYADVLEMSSYGFISFNKKLDIVHFNLVAEELFRIKAKGATNLSSLFIPASIKKIRKWEAHSEFALNDELMAVYDDQEFPVLADISKSKKSSSAEGIMIGLFENLESAKRKDLIKNTERIEDNMKFLMSNILPEEIAKTSTMEDFRVGKCKVFRHKRATAIFLDIADFSGISARTDPGVIIRFLHRLISNIDVLCKHHGLEKIKTIGDCYFGVSGIPTYRPLHAVSGMEFSIDVIRMVEMFNESGNPLLLNSHSSGEGEEGNEGKDEETKKIQIRAGLASGTMVSGVIGKTKRVFDVWGSAVNEASRMESHGIPGKIQVSRACYESLFGRSEEYDFMERRIQLQGIGSEVLAYVYTPPPLRSSGSLEGEEENGGGDDENDARTNLLKELLGLETSPVRSVGKE